jgi:hypothetical protein
MKSSEPRVIVDIQAEPATEIFLLDHQFQMRARGVGRIKTSVEPGLYKVKYRAGSQIVETYEEVSAGAGTVRLRAPDVPYASAAPLATSRTTHETHEGAASKLSRTIHHRVGQGSEIFVFARVWTEELTGKRRTPSVPRKHHPATGLSLRSPDGSVLVDIEKGSEVDLSDDPWAGCTIAVDPGAYRLRVETPKWGALEQTLIATEGWQTQVFLLQDNYSDGKTPAFRPDLAEASVLLGRKGKGFDPRRGELRLAELARQSLANQRVVLSGVELKRLFTNKRSSPMLGIYGSHALLAQGKRREISGAVRELGSILGDHPDVDALRLALSSRPSDKLSFGVPPMLTSSWSIIVGKASSHPDLVPAGSLASRVATCLWGSGPWLIWQADLLADQSEQGRSASLADVFSQIATIGATKGFDPAIVADQLSDTEAALYQALVPPSAEQRAPWASGAVAIEPVDAFEAAAPAFDVGVAMAEPEPAPAEEAASPHQSAEQIGASLGLPPSSLHAAADDLNRKLSEL